MRTMTLAAIAVLVGWSLVAASVQSGDVKTESKKVPVPDVALKDMPRMKDPDAVMKKWQIEVVWSRPNAGLVSRGINGFDAWLLSPEMIAALANARSKKLVLHDLPAQELYTQVRDFYYGPLTTAFYGEKIGFLVTIRVEFDINHAEDISSIWDFRLITEKGKQFKPARVVPQDTLFNMSYDPFRVGTWAKTYGLVFDNTDPDTKKPLINYDTHEISLMIGSDMGKGIARYQFDSKLR
ncbi:MAG TPA: hypothetical protein VFA07_00310 [Chthonomonadaceae bacterium]|nr:hypothetical protein [Chthonomonadaceae bacterium]